MRVHHGTNGQRWLRAPAWMATALVLSLAPSAPATPAQAPEEPAAPATSGDPIDLTAERIWSWDRGEERWAVLAGKAAALKGVEGLRAETIVARIRPEQPDGFRVEVFAEGKVRFTNRPGAWRDGRATLLGGSDPRVRPYEPGIANRVDGPPAAFLALIRRAFPDVDAAIAGAPASGPVEPVVVEPGPTAPEPAPNSEPAAGAPERTFVATGDAAVTPAQFDDGFPDVMNRPPVEDLPEDLRGPEAQLPDGGPMPNPADTDPAPTELAPLEEEGDGGAPLGPPVAFPEGADAPDVGLAPLVPYSQRIIGLYPRDSTPLQIDKLPPVRPDLDIFVIRGGVQVITTDPKLGIVDVSADHVVIWRGNDPKLPATRAGAQGAMIQDSRQSLEFYLEGNVVFRQDERKELGQGDQRTYRASRAYYDARSDRFRGLDAEADIFMAGLIAPMRTKAPVITQFRPEVRTPNGGVEFGLPQVRADQSELTGSRFPIPGYRFYSRSVDLTRVPSKRKNPITGTTIGAANNRDALTWQIDARGNTFFLGPLPVFYWPRFIADADDLDPPIRGISFRANNYFGQQVLTDWSGFKLLGLRKPNYIDGWNVDIDYLSTRGVALGSEIGWFGRELIPKYASSYFGYFDIWGLQDNGTDVLGAGPAVITGNSVYDGRSFQRDSVPPLEKFRGRVLLRHMQSLLDTERDPLQDFRVQLEAAYISDRNFLEQYYKRLFETGLDQSTLAYLIRQKNNWAFTGLAEVNLQGWYTESQWLPKLDYYRLGDSLFDRITYFGHTGVEYANLNTANEVNNPTIFGGRAFLPFDPVSNTSRVLQTGRFHTAHEFDLPLNFDVVRITPYVQGQLVGWTNQINGDSLGRAWGAVGGRLEAMAWRAFPTVESELLNVHGLNHKINFLADYRSAHSDVGINEIGVLDDLDDNTYEFVRRYFALSQYAGSLLPPQYDPRFLTLRRAMSPITSTTDVQGSIQTLQLRSYQRLQTKRGPEGKRRIIDYMTLDLSTTYFPQASRDNFGKSFGQNMYNYEWFIGDRTSIVSTGWFEFFDIGGQPLYKTNPDKRNNHLGLDVITTGISISRPPRGSVFIGYAVLNTGPIATSALISSFTYWLSPKWYATMANSYDFGNAILLGTMVSVTRIGADYLTTVGLNVDPQRQSYMFGFELVPRLSPNLRLGSANAARFDSRFAPTQ